MPSTVKWKKLKQQYESTSDAEEDLDTHPLHHRSSRCQLKQVVLFFNVCLFLFSILLIVLAGRVWIGNDTCVSKLSEYSPVLGAFDDTYERRRFDGKFNGDNVYRGQPRDELDWAWQYLVHGNSSRYQADTEPLMEIEHIKGSVFRASKSELEKANAPPEAIQIPSNAGDGYLAGIEGMHQLHCLNLIRMYTYQDYYRTRAMEWEDSPQTLRTHIDHCIDILRQKLMCDADAGIMTFAWVEGRPWPFPNFNVEHKCRDYEKLLKWNRDHDLEYKWEDLKPSWDAVILNAEP